VTLTRKGGSSSVRICECVDNWSPGNWGSTVHVCTAGMVLCAGEKPFLFIV